MLTLRKDAGVRMQRRFDGKQERTLAPKGSGPAAAQSWAAENAEAISERRALIKANGTPLADLQVLKID